MAIFSGQIIKDKGLAKYVGRVKQNKRMQRRHSNFYIDLHGKDWVESCELFAVEFQALMQLSPWKMRLLSTKLSFLFPHARIKTIK
jgi:hypothetical protein